MLSPGAPTRSESQLGGPPITVGRGVDGDVFEVADIVIKPLDVVVDVKPGTVDAPSIDVERDENEAWCEPKTELVGEACVEGEVIAGLLDFALIDTAELVLSPLVDDVVGAAAGMIWYTFIRSGPPHV
jgi:hypothetical protein